MVQTEEGDGGMVFASHIPGPRPEESRALILESARALWRNAQTLEDAERKAAEAEAWSRAERARTPGRYSTAAREDMMRARRMHGD